MSTIHYLTKVQFGSGLVSLLREELALLGVKRPMLVTDQGLRQVGLLDQVLSAQEAEWSPVIFDHTPPNPTSSAASEALMVFRESKADGLVALGGGSPIDLAKAVALLHTHEGNLEDYAAVNGGMSKIRPDIVPLIAVPTTAGTGSEVGRSAIMTMDSHLKVAVASPYLIPKVAICDPELTLGLPPYLTAATGMDAITHCVETYLSTAYNPPAEAIALDGLAKGMGAIKKAVLDGKNLEARSNMMMAALEGAMAFQKGLGAVHAMSHVIGAFGDKPLHHGTLNAIFLPHVLRFNQDVVGNKYPRLCAAMGMPSEADPADIISKLIHEIHLPSRLRDLGVDREVLKQAAQNAEADFCNTTNPKKANATDYEKLFNCAY